MIFGIIAFRMDSLAVFGVGITEFRSILVSFPPFGGVGVVSLGVSEPICG